MATDDLPTLMGLKSSLLMSGLAGGLVAAIMGTGGFWQRLASGAVGFLCANFIAPLLLQAGSTFYLVTHATETGVGFIVGLCGMTICEFIIRFATRGRDRAENVADKIIDRKLG